MISQRFSSNKQAKAYDLKRAFRQCLAPVIIMLANLLFSLCHTTRIELQENKFNNTKVFVNLISEYQSVFELALIFYGFFFAIVLFAPFMKKKNANFFFSSPVTRADIFRNRAIAGVVSIVGIIAFTVILDTIFNCVALPNDGYIILTALGLFYECVMYAVVTFAITAIGMSAANNLLEGFVLSVGIYGLPTGIVAVVNFLCRAFLYGYNRQSLLADTILRLGWSSDFDAPSLLSATANLHPFLLGARVGEYEYDLFDLCFQIKEKSDSKFALPDMSYIAPLIAWSVVFVALMFVAKHLFVRRKSENLGMISKNKSVIAFLVTEMALGISTLWVEMFTVGDVESKLVRALLILVLFAVSWIGLYSLFCLKVMHSKATWTCFGSAFGVLAVAICLLGGGLFGYSNYVPEVDDIKFASIIGTGITADMDGALCSDDILETYYDAANGMCLLDDKDDLRIFTDVHRTLIDGERNTNNSISIVYELNNGRRVYRRYDYVTAQGMRLVPSLVDTKEYRQNFYHYLTGEGDDIIGLQTAKYKFGEGNFFNLSIGIPVRNRGVDIAELKIGPETRINDYSEEFLKAFRQSLVADFKNMTYKDIFFNEHKALGCIKVYRVEYDEDYLDRDYGYDGGSTQLYIYPCMTNTINLLKENGYYKYLIEDEMDDYEAVYYMQLGEYGNCVRNESDLFTYMQEDYWYYESFDPSNYVPEENQSTDEQFIRVCYDNGDEYRFATDEDYVAVFVKNDNDNMVYQKKLIIPVDRMKKILK